MKKIRGNKGITLIALVISIIILLILAAITINLTIGERGILTRAREAGRNYQNAANYEDEQLAKLLEGEQREEKKARTEVILMREKVYLLMPEGKIRNANGIEERELSKVEIGEEVLLEANGIKQQEGNILIDNDGKLYEWNEIENKYICITDIAGSVLQGKDIVDIVTNGSTVIARDSNSKLYTWGNNWYGQCGDGTTENRSTPICISDIAGSVLQGKNIVDVVTDGRTVITRDSNGKVYAWGNNWYGQCGDGTTEYRSTPICISDIAGSVLQGKNITGVVNYDAIVIARESNGKLYGLNWEEKKYICISDEGGSVLQGKNIVDVVAYGDTVIARDSNGKLYGLNWEEKKYICISDEGGSVLQGKNIVDVVAYGDTVIARDSNGKLYTWGYNAYGQCGDGTTEYRENPICISDEDGSVLQGKNIIDVVTNGDTVIAVDNNGKVYAWGDNWYGQCGNGTTENRITTPICMNEVYEGFKDVFIDEIGIKTDGDDYCIFYHTQDDKVFGYLCIIRPE